MKIRSSGVLLHVTSLPSEYGIGDLGPGAFDFIDFLKTTNQSMWQLLPLNPTDNAHGNSPYSSNSAFAGNPLLISPQFLYRDGFIGKKDLSHIPTFPPDRVEFHRVTEYKYSILNAAFEHFYSRRRKPPEYEQFCKEESFWLDDYALFVATKRKFNGRVWGDWHWEIRDRHENALRSLRDELEKDITRQKYYQFLFFKQWNEIKNYANNLNISLFGDLPIYVNYDSADVWTHPQIFKLNEAKKPAFVAGVPPDLFSATGQLWGNPVFNWEALRQSEFNWWLKRVRHNLKLFNLIRIDHFRGLIAYWEVPAHEPTAVNGRWVNAPAEDFLNILIKTYPTLPLVAEDLGLITPDVREVMIKYSIPGMKVLLFAFFDDMVRSPYIPHNHVNECIVYTGTHDNNTVRGWFQDETSESDRNRVFEYIGRVVSAEEIAWEFIRLAMMSPAYTIIIPLQDILSLGSEARMNKPATSVGNWEWRFTAEQLSAEIKDRLKHMTYIYGRS